MEKFPLEFFIDPLLLNNEIFFKFFANVCKVVVTSKGHVAYHRLKTRTNRNPRTNWQQKIAFLNLSFGTLFMINFPNDFFNYVKQKKDVCLEYETMTDSLNSCVIYPLLGKLYQMNYLIVTFFLQRNSPIGSPYPKFRFGNAER